MCVVQKICIVISVKLKAPKNCFASFCDPLLFMKKFCDSDPSFLMTPYSKGKMILSPLIKMTIKTIIEHVQLTQMRAQMLLNFLTQGLSPSDNPKLGYS